ANGESRNGHLALTVVAPSRAGRYRLELQIRDSDGAPLTEQRLPAIPSAAVRVYGADAVTYELRQDDAGLAVGVTNVGRQTIPPAPADDPSADARSTLSAWIVAPDGTATP